MVELSDVELCLTFSIWPFKRQFSAADRTLFNLNAYCGTMFSLSGDKGVHLIRKLYPIHSLKVKTFHSQVFPIEIRVPQLVSAVNYNTPIFKRFNVIFAYI
jgi:hypothetical protein